MASLGLDAPPIGAAGVAWGQAALAQSPVRLPGLWTWPQAKAKGGWAEGYLIDESEQLTGSFKFRAGWAVVAGVPNHHLLTVSSGNFAAGLAYAAKALGKRCTVLMPQSADPTKVASVRALGAEVVFVDTRLETRAMALARWSAQYPEAYVASPFDDERCIAGNAGLGLAIAALKPDVVVCPVGGGGLAAGVLEGLRAAGSQALLVGAEPLAANDVAMSWRRGERVSLPGEPDTMADGVRTMMVGERCWARLEKGLADVVEVREPDIASAFSALLGMGIHPEPTAALAPAAAWAQAESWRGLVVCAIVCGGNVAPERSAAIAQAPASW